MDGRSDGWDDLPVDPDLVDGPTDRTTPTDGATPTGARTDPRILAAIALGAMPGAAARYGLSQLITAAPDTFPWATFWTNISGSLVLGALLVVLIQRYPPSRYARAFAGTGFLGAYTTFSTFGVEADLLAKDGHVATAVAYVAASLVVGVAAAWLGVTLVRMVASRRLRPQGKP